MKSDDQKNIKGEKKEEKLESTENTELKEDKETAKDGEEKKVKELEAKVKEFEDKWLRSVADYRNLERRIEEEKKEWIKFANKDLLLKLFPAFETLYLAAKYIKDDGLLLTIKKIDEVFKEIGVEKIETQGKKYDATKMECVEVVEGEEDVVVEEVRPGFLLHSKVLQPAVVKVGKKKS